MYMVQKKRFSFRKALTDSFFVFFVFVVVVVVVVVVVLIYSVTTELEGTSTGN